jgi:site-specific DNA-methyltransferase (adenine-specific)
MTIDLRHGDAIEELRSMATASVDLVLTDPPYFLPAEHYAMRTKWARSLSDLSIIEHFLGDVVTESRRILRPSGCLAMFCDGQSYPVIYARAYLQFDRIADVVWDKGQIGMGAGIRRRHELVMVGVPSTYAWESWIPSVLNCPAVPSTDRIHPAQKPVDLLRHLIRTLSPKGGTVCDPFSGSGSTAEAARLEGRSAIAVERDINYHEQARVRLERVAPDSGLFATLDIRPVGP